MESFADGSGSVVCDGRVRKRGGSAGTVVVAAGAATLDDEGGCQTGVLAALGAQRWGVPVVVVILATRFFALAPERVPELPLAMVQLIFPAAHRSQAVLVLLVRRQV